MNPHSVDEAVEYIYRRAKRIAWHDVLRDLRELRESGNEVVSTPVGEENGKRRGMIYAFFNGWKQMGVYMPSRKAVHVEDERFYLFTQRFTERLSRHLDEGHDMGRAIAPDKDGRWALIAMGLFKRLEGKGRKKLIQLVGDAFETDQGLVDFFGAEEAGRLYSADKVYRALFADAYHGRESARTETALLLPFVTGNKVVMARQRILAQPDEELDVIKQDADPLGGSRAITYSRLGASDILLLGPRGLERRARLRLSRGADRIYTLDSVMVDSEQVPVVMEETQYAWNPDSWRVERSAGPSPLSYDAFAPFRS